MRGQYPGQVLNVEQYALGVRVELRGDIRSHGGQVAPAVETRPDGRPWEVQVVQVLAVEDDDLAVELEPVDALGPPDLGTGGYGSVAELPRRWRRADRRAEDRWR